jgi:putative ABC transport system permease protein
MIEGLLARARSLWRGLLHRSSVEAEMHDEFRFHIEARTEDMVRVGLSRAEAARRASIEFGSFERFKDEARASRGLKLFDELAFSWLDVRLALRMLKRYPGLTVVGGLAMAFGIAAGVVGFEVMTQLASPRLPLSEGDRIVALQNWLADGARVPESPRLDDFDYWRDELESVTDLAAFRTVRRNLIDDERAESIELAEITATAIGVTRVPPLLGRWLQASDEAAGASAVMVIGFDAWQARFGGEPGVVGRLVRLGNVPTTIVGVMPAGFAFPVAHDFWVPLSPTTLSGSRDAVPGLVVFGRLADGVGIEQAQAELATIGAYDSATPAQKALLPRVIPYTYAIFEPAIDFWIGVGLGNVFLLMLIVLACANVALLLFARAVTREVELTLKSALGASRARLVTQFFAEALVLAALAFAIGLGVARVGLDSFLALSEVVNGESRLPFWAKDTLSPMTVAYAAVLTLLAALIAGLVPALMMTRRDHRVRLSRMTSGGGTTRIGGVWTALIVVQVAVTVLFPAAAFNFHRWASPVETTELGFSAAEYVSARLAIEPASPAASTGLAQVRAELTRRLTSDARAFEVTFASQPPGAVHEQAWFELDGDAAAAQPSARSRASVASVAFDFFDVLGTTAVAGRSFLAAEQRASANVAIVNEAFVEQALGGRNPLGRSIRRAASRTGEPGGWHEIIGVVPGLGMRGNPGGPGVYFALQPDAANQYLLARHRADIASFAALLRKTAIAIDADLQLHEVMALDEVQANNSVQSRYVSRFLVVVSAVALLLSLMAIYAVVDFTVSRRTREIGLRIALGAAPQSILAAVFRRPLLHVGVGIFIGGLLVVLTSSAMFGGPPTVGESVLMGSYVFLMSGVCLLACVVPTRRALCVHPMEALRAD